MTLFFCGPNCLAYYCGQSHGGFDVNNFNNQGEEFVRDGPTFAITLKDCMGPGVTKTFFSLNFKIMLASFSRALFAGNYKEQK